MEFFVMVRAWIKRTEDSILTFGEEFEESLDGKNEWDRHVWTLILNFPLVLFMYAWMELAPYSDHWILYGPLLVIRYIGLFTLVIRFASSVGTTLLLHVVLTLALSMTWLSQHVYWTLRSRSYSSGDHTTYVWFLMIGAFILQDACVVYLYGDTEEPNFFQNNSVEITKVVWLASISYPELIYWWSALLLISAIGIQAGKCEIFDTQLDRRRMLDYQRDIIVTTSKIRQKELTHKIEYLRQKIAARTDLFALPSEFEEIRRKVFTNDMLIFMLLFILVETIRTLSTYGSTITEQNVVEVAMKVLSSCCTNAVHVWALVMMFRICADHIVYFNNSILNISQPICLNVANHQLYKVIIVAFIEANAITTDNQTRQFNLKGVLVLVFVQIFIHVQTLVENEILAIVNSAANISWKVSLRLAMPLAAIVVIPCLITTMAFESLGVSKMSLFKSSGVFLILVKMSMLVMEGLVIRLCWRMPEQQERLEGWVFKIRVIKIFVVTFAIGLQLYYRLMQPFLKGFFWCRLVFNIILFTDTVIYVFSSEWKTYQNRNQCLFMLDSLSEMTMTNMADDVSECALCYRTLYEGKQLPCEHVFHCDCLRRWFQVKTNCPLCNT